MSKKSKKIISDYGGSIETLFEPGCDISIGYHPNLKSFFTYLKTRIPQEIIKAPKILGI